MILIWKLELDIISFDLIVCSRIAFSRRKRYNQKCRQKSKTVKRITKNNLFDEVSLIYFDCIHIIFYVADEDNIFLNSDESEETIVRSANLKPVYIFLLSQTSGIFVTFNVQEIAAAARYFIIPMSNKRVI